MPVYSRRGLRQALGVSWLRDTVVGQTSGSWGTQAGSLNIVDSSQADPTASGEQLYQRHWLRLLGSAGVLQDTRVGSFNTGSGAFLSAVTAATTIFSGMPFEVHALLSPAEKDRELNGVVQKLRVQQELPIWGVQDLHVYSLGPEVLDVLDVRYFSYPLASRNEAQLTWYKLVSTATGQELRVSPSLEWSQQLVLDAVLAVSLGAGEQATINLPDQDWLLAGAAARCLWLVEQRSPGQEAAAYRNRRGEVAREFTRLSARFQPKIAKKVQLDEPW